MSASLSPRPVRPLDRPSYRVPLGLPLQEEGRWGTPFSAVMHALILFLMITPLFDRAPLLDPVQGAGGPGPAGGGGGGRRGSGGAERVSERVQYLTASPPAAPVTPPLVPLPQLVQPPPVVAVQSKPADPLVVKLEVPRTDIDMALTRGVGGGTGNDGSTGNGPGSGGGIGSGVGTGRGSSIGAGTGGGPGTIYPPTTTQVFIPPLPAPERIKPYRLTATFDVDSTGKVLRVEFNQSKDGSYNRQLKERLDQTRFRPATRWDGSPVRATAQITYDFP
ncbi:MAG: hypothetical protein M3068_03055 [Gemmatimonadota bacterium]|nr:hypothetical protein [Gemmatimonadota bacterium]